jgi:hypothetical protein
MVWATGIGKIRGRRGIAEATLHFAPVPTRSKMAYARSKPGNASMQFVLIDFENVQPANLDGLKQGVHHIRVFVGESQSKISLVTAKALQSFGSDAEYIQIAGSGSNALDFHLAFYLGRLSLQHPQASFVIVSKDTGFDPLVKHLNRLGTACRRVASIATAVGATPKAAPVNAAAPSPPPPTAMPAATQKGVEPKAAQQTASTSEAKPASKPGAKATTKAAAAPSDALIKTILDRLRGMKSARPRTLKTLTSSITSWHTLDEPRCAAVRKALVDGGHIATDGKKVVYNLG